jgi:Tfp pilus assembly protein PilF
MELDPLSALAIRHGTDKFGFHDYTPVYHRLFSPWRNRPVRILEIGVGGYGDEDRGGESLATWRDYFPQGEVTGLDIQKKTLALGDRVRIYQGSQVDPDFLERVVAERGPFDLIVDDGSHRNEHVVESFRLLWPTLAPGGIYVVEDVQTAFMPRFGGSLDLVEPNSVGMGAAILGDMAAQGVAAVTRNHNMIAFHRESAGWWHSALWDEVPGAREGREDQDASGVRRLPGDADASTLEAALSALDEPGMLVVEQPLGDVALGWLRRLFVQVDHREMRVHFPDAPIDPMATHVRSVELHRDGALIHKAPNDYPSNFGFDLDHPAVAIARNQIEAVLAAEPDCGAGFIQYAQMLSGRLPDEEVAPWLRKAEAAGVTARRFYQLSAAMAQRAGRRDEAERYYAEGAARYPDDSGLTRGLIAMRLARQDLDGADEVARAALERMPRDFEMHLSAMRVADRRGESERSIELGRKALKIAGQARKLLALNALGAAFASSQQWAEAEATFASATELPPARHSIHAWRGLARARTALGDAQGADTAMARAEELALQA